MTKKKKKSNQKLKHEEVSSALLFPSKGDIINGVKIVNSECKFQDGVFKYRIVFPKGTRKSDIPNILRNFYSNHFIEIDGIDSVITAHDYGVKSSRKEVIASGSMDIVSLARTNPQVKQLTALQDFDEDYSEMEMTTPHTFFRVFPFRGYNGPKFRAKLFSFVSYRGESYGYSDSKNIYLRRASPIMPKCNVTKAPKDATMFNHTLPKKDERPFPTLTSADDYLLYFDMSHKPRNIRHFYTVMADRMDYFHVVPKHSKKKYYVKLKEEKIIKDIDVQIDEIGDRLSEKMPNETYDDQLYWTEEITRELVRWLNKKYSNYFTIKYKCYYKIKKNPQKEESDDLHLGDEFIAKALNDIKEGKYGWPEFSSEGRPHENYAYWHSQYYSGGKDTAGEGYLGLLPGDMRRFTHFMRQMVEGSNYNYYDLLNILNISYDIRRNDSEISDGKDKPSRIEDIMKFLEIDNEVLTENIIMLDSLNQGDIYNDSAKTMAGDYYFILAMSDFSIKSVEKMQDVKDGKIDLELAKFQIMSKLKVKMGKEVAAGLGNLNDKTYSMGSYINPPIVATKGEYATKIPKFDRIELDLLKEALAPYAPSRHGDVKDLIGQREKFNLRVPVEEHNTVVTMMIAISTGYVQIFVPANKQVLRAKGFPEKFEGRPSIVALEAFKKVVDQLNKYGTDIPMDDIQIGESEPARNPSNALVISITSPIQEAKDKAIDSLNKRLPDSKIVTTYTTKTLKPYEKRPHLVEVDDNVFDKLEANGDILMSVAFGEGDRRGYKRSDFAKGNYILVDSMVKDQSLLDGADSTNLSFYLHPKNDEATIEKYLRKSVSPQEAKRVSNLVPYLKGLASSYEFDYTLDFDIDDISSVSELVYNEVPKKNPSVEPSEIIAEDEHSVVIINPSKKISIRIEESTNSEKKLMAVFTKPNGKTKTIHFGARGMSDYTQHKDKDRMKNYLARHSGTGEDWDDPMTAGALSRWILWGKPSLRESFNDFKKRFNLEGVMAVTNTKMNPPKGMVITHFLDKSESKKYKSDLYRIDAHLNEKNIGYLTYYDNDSHIWLEHIKVKPDYRGKDVAKPLMEKFLDMHKGKQIQLHARNSKLVKYYKQYGFDSMEGYDQRMVLENPPIELVSRRGTKDNISRFFDKDSGKELTNRMFANATIDTTKEKLVFEVGNEIIPFELLQEEFALIGVRRRYNVAKWGNRTVIQQDPRSNRYFEKIDFKLPIFLESDPLSIGEPSAFVSTRGILVFDESEDNFTLIQPNEITDFEGVAKSDSPIPIPVYKYAKVVKRTPGIMGGPIENPGWRHGEEMEDDPFDDQFD